MSRAGGRYETDVGVRERDYYRGGGARSRYDEVDVDVRERDSERRRQPDFLREDYGRTSAGPVVLASDRRKPAHDYEEEVILVRSKSKNDRSRDLPGRYRDDFDVDIRESESRRPEKRRERDDIDVEIRRDDNEKRSVAPSRRNREELDVDIRESDARSRTSRRDHEHDDIDVRIRSSSRPARPQRSTTEDIVFRRGEGAPRRPTESVADRDDIRIRRDEYESRGSRRKEESRDKINIDIHETSRERAPPPRPRSNYDKDEIDIRIRDREREKRPVEHDNTLVIRERSQSRPRRVASAHEEYYFRRQRSPSPPPRNDQEEIIIRRKQRSPSPPPPPPPRNDQEEIIIRRTHRTPSPSPSPPRAPSPPTPEPIPELPPIIRPPIHQEFITHHRHIDHGMIRAVSSSSSSPSPPPKRREKRKDDVEVEIRRRTDHGEEDIRIRERDDDVKSHKAKTVRSSSSSEKIETRSRARSAAPSRARSKSRGQKERERENFELSLEINNNVNNERGLVPRPPQPPAPPQRPKEMWTEITKDLVSREAIEYMGYPYEETADFFYVMEYMRYEDVTRLVELSEDLHRDRRERIEQIQWERKDPRLPEPRAPDGGRRAIEGPRDRHDYDERIYEREVIYEDGTRRRYRI